MKSKTLAREQVLSEVVQAHSKSLLSVINRMIRDRGEAEDILQDVFSEFIEAYDLGQTFETAGAWLMTVAKNKIFDRFRKKKVEQAHQNDVLSQVRSLPKVDVMPGNEWMQELLRFELVSALQTLPVEQLEVFVKNELEGKTFEQIAAETGENINTLLARKRYAVISLRKYLKEVYDELE